MAELATRDNVRSELNTKDEGCKVRSKLREGRYTRAPPPYPLPSPLMTTSPACPPVLMARGTTDAIKGNSTGAVLMTRMVLPEPGLSRTQKNGLEGKSKRGEIGALGGASERLYGCAAGAERP